MPKIPTVDDYTKCFKTDAGKRVLANMLTEAKFFQITKGEGEQAVENFMKVVLSKTGCYPSSKSSKDGRIDEFVRNMLNMKAEY